MIRNNPNASVTAAVSGSGALIVWILALLGVTMPPAAAAVLAGFLATVVLAIGRDGLTAILNRGS